MVNKNEIEHDGAALWARARDAFGPADSGPAPDEVVLAAYLEGRLAAGEAARVEAWLAASDSGVDLVASARHSLAIPPEEAPDRTVQRAQAILGFTARESSRGLTGWLMNLVPPSWQPAHALGALCVLALLGAGSFELGREGAMVLAEPQQSADEDLATVGFWPSDSLL